MTNETLALQQHEVHLLHRLNVGLAKIDAARANGRDVSAWEDLWVSLLQQYEQTYDKLAGLER